MQFRKGFLVLKLSGGVPVMIHWTALAMAVMVSGFRFQPGTWLAVFIIIFIHELGHATAVWKAHATVTAICMDGTGGYCEWTGSVTNKQRLAIVWGGVLAQLLLWSIAAVSSLFIHPPISDLTMQLLHTLLGWNLFILALNLLPIKPLDGHQAWRLLRMVWQDWRRKQQRMRGQRLAAKTFKQLELDVAPKSEIQVVVNQILERAAVEHKAKKQVAESKED